MKYSFKFSPETQQLIRCPICKAALNWSDNQIQCQDENCQEQFPIINNIPILINNQNSVFAIEDFKEQQSTTFDLSYNQGNRLKRTLRRIKEYHPKIGNSFHIDKHMETFKETLKKTTSKPRVLIIGGSIKGNYVDILLDDPDIEVVETDVSFGPRTMLIFDAHDIPFEDSSFDGILAQATLEHVAAPWRCVDEFYRVTKDGGVVFATIPFVSQVHMGRYDFTRFTHLGNRRLFRRYREIESGLTNGPGMALAWSYFYFLMSFSRSRLSQALLRRIGAFSAFWLKYFDYYLLYQPGSYDAAAGYYFIGQKEDGYLLTDRELIKLYRGIQ